MRRQPILLASLFAVSACSAAGTADGTDTSDHKPPGTSSADTSDRSTALRPGSGAKIADTPAGLSSAYRSCVDKTPEVPRRGECAEEEIARQDARLNAAYVALRDAARRHPDLFDAAALVRSQRAWLIASTEGCNASMLRFGSDAGPTTLAECRMRELASRSDQLEQWLQDTALDK